MFDVFSLQRADDRAPEVFVPDGLEGLFAAVDDRRGRERADELEERGDDLVAGAVDVAGAEDEPVGLRRADELLGAELRAVVVGAAAVGAERRDVDEPADARAR
jgi:hypothetical protein